MSNKPDETLKITRVNALKAFHGGDQQLKDTFKKLFPDVDFNGKITDIVKSYEDACEILGQKPLTLSDFSFLPERDRVSSFAYHKLTIIARALNEGWKPNWANTSEYKYYPWLEASSAGSRFSFHVDDFGLSGSYVGSRLVFKTSDLAKYAAQQFEDIYNEYFLLQ